MLRGPVAVLAAALTAVGTGAGAAPSRKPPTAEAIQAYLADKPPEARPIFEHVMTEGQRNAVLYLMRAGLASMDAGDFRAAADAFDQALQAIEAVYADSPTAAKARSKFVKEAIKDFKGEGYERAMAYYYRGVLYLYDGDYENARASFQGGQLQDQWAEDQQYQSDFALFEVLSGWASQCAGDPAKAQEFYGHARQIRAGLPIPGPDDKVLMLSEYGASPVKWADGKYQENLRYRAGDSGSVSTVSFRLGDIEAPGRPGENLAWQAATRGGRQVDAILAGKASFKESTSEFSSGTGQAAMIAVQSANTAMAQANSMAAQGYNVDYSAANTMAYAGLALGALSMLSGMAAAAAKPQADIRYWDNLPGELVYASAPSASALGEVEFRAANGAPVAAALLEPRMDARGACGVAWARDSRAYAVPAEAPNSQLKK